MNDFDIILYHKDCNDGVASAFVAWKYLKNKKKNSNKSKYIPILHYDYKLIKNIITNKKVLMLDICFNNNDMMKLLKRVSKLTLIDHHKSTLEYDCLELIDNKYIDINYSASVLAWKYFFQKKSIPLLLQYIQDNDLWINKIKYTKEFNIWYSSLKYTHRHFNDINKLLSSRKIKKGIKSYGIKYKKLNDTMIEKEINNCTIKLCKINNTLYFIGYSTSSHNDSIIGDKILEKYTCLDFSVIFSFDNVNNYTYVSLYSTNNKQDVSKIAEYFGGGGHRNAAGFRFDNITNIIGEEISSNIHDYNIISNHQTKFSPIYGTCMYIDSNTENIYYLIQYLFQNINHKQKAQTISKSMIPIKYIFVNDEINENFIYFEKKNKKKVPHRENQIILESPIKWIYCMKY